MAQRGAPIVIATVVIKPTSAKLHRYRNTSPQSRGENLSGFAADRANRATTAGMNRRDEPGASTSSSSTLVALIDGDCALCSGYARLVSALDGKGAVYFETQQSDAGRALLKRCGMPTDLSSIVVVEVSPKGKAIGYVRSTAVLRTFLALGAPWSALYLTVAIPEFIRDGVYGLVAKHRYSVFGTNGGRCALPDAVTRRRIGRKLPAGLLD